MARIKVLIRRSKDADSLPLKILDLEMNTAEQTVRRNGRMLDLTRTEYCILEYLMRRPKALVSKRELLHHLHDDNGDRHSNVIEAHISNLRRKLNADHTKHLIETVRHRGYRLDSQREA